MIPPLELLDFLKKQDDFLIATHFNPDGDCLGSALSLSMALRSIGKQTTLLCKDRVPAQYKFLPGSDAFITFETIKNSESGAAAFDNLILVDCNDLDRISSEPADYKIIGFRNSIVIDHHETERPFGDIKWIEPQSAATALMIFYIIRNLGIEITGEMAVNLYAAIAVDTGNFKYENTSPEVFSISSELVRAGARPSIIYRELFESWSDSRFNLFIKVMNTLHVEDGIASIEVSQKMFEDTSTTPDDTENFVEFLRVMKNVNVSVLFRQIDEDHYKLSLRSTGDFNVAAVAKSFGGGGHKNAAGCRIRERLSTAKKMLIEKLKSAAAYQ